MKIVLNKCFGGFSVSKAAIRYCRDNGALWAQWPYTFLPGEKWVTYNGLGGEKTVHDEVSDCVHIDDCVMFECRTCNHLIRLVELYNETSDGPINPNGPHSQLSISVIEDDAEYSITDQDGIESAVSIG